MNPTDQATPLTQESVRLHNDDAMRYGAPSGWPECGPDCWLCHRLRAIEAAAARRAIEGSGVVSVERLLDAWEALEHPSIDAAIAAALPRPEEPRVERCADCGNGRDTTIEVHADPGAAWPFHPFTPEAR